MEIAKAKRRDKRRTKGKENREKRYEFGIVLDGQIVLNCGRLAVAECECKEAQKRRRVFRLKNEETRRKLELKTGTTYT